MITKFIRLVFSEHIDVVDLGKVMIFRGIPEDGNKGDFLGG
jgi:hypothetical protein